MSPEPGPPPPADAPETDGRRDASVVTQFFLIPLAVVAGLVGIFLLFTLATHQAPGPRDYLKTLTSGRFNQRWQAAFELSNLLRDGRGVQEDPELVSDLVRVFRESGRGSAGDPRVRRYLALALGNSRSPTAAPALLEGVRDEDGETRLYSLWGLAHLGSPSAVPIFEEGLQDPDPAVRSIAAYGLGVVPGELGGAGLRKALRDPVEEVRWNAALALGRRGDPSGEEILVGLLDRAYLDRFNSMDPGEKTSTILNSLRALKHLKTKGLGKKTQELAESDPDPRVREAARTWAGPKDP